MITRRPKLRRQKKIFRQQGKMPRPEQLNINVATWGRLLKRNLNFQKSLPESGGGSIRAADPTPPQSSTGKTNSRAHFLVKGLKLHDPREFSPGVCCVCTLYRRTQWLRPLGNYSIFEII